MPHKKEEWKGACYGDEVREKLLAFAEAGWDSIPEDEREAWFTRFKFWGLFHQRSGQESYFMMRLSNADGVLKPGQLRAIADVADEYATGPASNPEFGNGYIDLTTRQSVQLHWIKLEDVPAIWERLEGVGVTTRSAGGDTMRNVTGSPTAGKDAREVLDTRPLLARIQEGLRGDDALANLPRKFNISVSGIPDGAAQDALNDIGLEPAVTDLDGEERVGFNVRVGGGLGGHEPRVARPLDVFVTPERAYDVVRGFVELYHDLGNRQNRRKNRSRFFVDERGPAAIRTVLQEEYVDFPLRTAGTDFRDRYSYNAGRGDAGPADYVGVHDQHDGRYYVGLNVPVGRLPATDAVALADLAGEFGSGEVRLTRRQNPLIMDVPEADVAALLAEPLLETYPPEPNPFQRGGMACTGTEFCSLALTETKARMARMLRWLRDNVDLPDDVEEVKIHFSGCTADCGHANTADIGLLGMRARKDGEMVEALDIGVGGGLGPDPGFVDWIRQRVPADEVPGALASLLEAFAAHREDGQTFREWVAATPEEALVELCAPAETDYEDPCMYDAKQSWYPFAEGASPAPTAPDGTPLPSDD
ncbi:nitrite/sulfite reductase [Halomarina ordinaria]|uniref:Nitrite/sulfite reductase n=1 Tax=Halomarina ordinaria TaxID=3033939 RepID=A0ABD5U8V3_9EURY|nr:ferredoxin--nitrite reductase [Halomarina sp. PSRA2]